MQCNETQGTTHEKDTAQQQETNGWPSLTAHSSSFRLPSFQWNGIVISWKEPKRMKWMPLKARIWL